MLFLRCLKEDIRSRIYEERDVSSIGRFASLSQPFHLVRDLSQRAVFWKAVLQVATDRAGVDGKSHRFTDFFGGISITALQVHRHLQVRSGTTAAKIVHPEVQRSII